MQCAMTCIYLKTQSGHVKYDEIWHAMLHDMLWLAAVICLDMLFYDVICTAIWYAIATHCRKCTQAVQLIVVLVSC